MVVSRTAWPHPGSRMSTTCERLAGTLRCRVIAKAVLRATARPAR